MNQGVALNFDATNVPTATAFDPLPSGWYNARIIENEQKPTKDGKGQYLAFTLEILDGPAAGRKVFDRLNLWNANSATVEMATKTLSSICHATNVVQCGNANQLMGIPMKVKLKYKAAEGNYEAGNDVSAYDAYNSQHELVTSLVINAPAAQTPNWGAMTPPGGPAGFAAAPAGQPPIQAGVAAMAGAFGASSGQPWAQPGVAAGAPPAPGFAAAPPALGALSAPPPPQATHVMLPAAGGVTYEAYKAQNWTDEQLIANGLMAAPSLNAPPAPGLGSGAGFGAPPAPGAAAAAAPGGNAPPWVVPR